MGQLLEGIWNQHVCMLVEMIHKNGDAEGERGKNC